MTEDEKDMSGISPPISLPEGPIKLSKIKKKSKHQRFQSSIELMRPRGLAVNEDNEKSIRNINNVQSPKPDFKALTLLIIRIDLLLHA